MIFTTLAVAFFSLSFALAYFFWLIPLLRSRPAFAEFSSRTDSFWHAVWLKIAFIKTKLVAGSLMLASAMVSAYDALAPLANSLGIDWTPLTSKIPGWAYPIAAFSLGAVFYWLRKVTAREHDQVVSDVQQGVPVHEAMMLVATEPRPKDDAPKTSE